MPKVKLVIGLCLSAADGSAWWLESIVTDAPFISKFLSTGAQMKTTHNLRLLCAQVLDLCRHKPHTVG